MDLSIEDIDNIKKDIEKALPGELSVRSFLIGRLDLVVGQPSNLEIQSILYSACEGLSG